MKLETRRSSDEHTLRGEEIGGSHFRARVAFLQPARMEDPTLTAPYPLFLVWTPGLDRKSDYHLDPAKE